MSGKTEESGKDDILAKPRKTIGDGLHTTVRALMAAVTFIGSPAEKLFTELVAPPIVRRRDEWVEKIALCLLQMENEGQVKIENLLENDLFQTTLLNATQLAIRNHQLEKKEALQNAVLNTALQKSPDEGLQLMFLAFIDVFTPTHIRILKFFENPQEWAQKNNITFPNPSSGTAADALNYAYPKLGKELTDAVVKDLSDRGLMYGGNMHGGRHQEGRMMVGRTTAMGKKFLKFISSPIEDESVEKEKIEPEPRTEGS